jgi:cytochrome P450
MDRRVRAQDQSSTRPAPSRATTGSGAGAAQPPGPSEPHDVGDAEDSLERLTQWSREYGDTFRVYSPARESWTWVIRHPDDVGRVLVTGRYNYVKGIGIDRVRLLLGNGIMTSEGDFWRRQRRMMQPAFNRGAVDRYVEVIRRANARLLERWEEAAACGEPMGLQEALSEVTLEAILRAVFSDDAECVGDGHASFTMVASQRNRDPRFAFEFRRLARDVADLARRRSRSGRHPNDLLQTLIEARDPDDGEAMGERALVDEVLTLVIAGHETTASALAWAWWLLAQHPDVERRLHAEQDRIGDLEPASHAALARMPYSVQVLNESMRLYPPGWLLSRRTLGPDQLGGYSIPAGTDVLVSPYLVHRHPRYWERPEDFDPGHFNAERVARRHRYAYIPFGVGPRHCIGENFAMLEMMLHLNAATRRFRLRPVEHASVIPEARVNLRMAGDLPVRVERR